MNLLSRLIAIDPSLTCSGWALFSLDKGELLGVGKVRSLSPKLHLAERLNHLQQRIEGIVDSLQLSSNDVLVCEAPTSMLDPKAAFKVEQVRSIFETVARSRSIDVPGRINPRTVQRDVMGLASSQQKRVEVKRTARAVVKNLFNNHLERLGFNTDEKNLSRNQDIVDAILIGYFGVSRLRQSIQAGVAPAVLFAEGQGRQRYNRY